MFYTTICDFCGKEMLTSDGRIDVRTMEFAISKRGVPYWMCGECKQDFNKWWEERKENKSKI